jgi:predicted metalloprotease with PDZ domain
MLNWNLPRFRRIIPHMPKRLLIVSAGDPMWRGGLSGPNSLFLHSDRPMISENGTSTLIHELMHVTNRLKAESGSDWIVEGIAEYYSLKIMWRSGTITERRYQQALQKLEKWGLEAERLDVDRSSGPVTARAVGVLRKLDREIHAKTKQEKSLDEVVERMTLLKQKVSLQRLRKAVVKVMGEPAEALADEQLGLVAGDLLDRG